MFEMGGSRPRHSNLLTGGLSPGLRTRHSWTLSHQQAVPRLKKTVVRITMSGAKRPTVALVSLRRTRRLSPRQHRQFSSTSAARADFTHAVSSKPCP